MNRRIFALCGGLLLSVSSAFAQVAVNVSGAQRAAQPISILPVQNDPGVRMDYIISSDLYKTGLFQPISPNRIRNRPQSPAQIDYNEFSQLGVNYVLLGRMQNQNAGQFVLSGIASKNVLFNENIQGSNPRQTAHAAADAILQRLTGIPGAFATRIAYVMEQHSGSTRTYSLITSDIDGANRRVLVSSSQPIISPDWSPDGNSIAYMTYSNGSQSQIVVQSVAGSGHRVLVESYGTMGAPAFSPNGQQLVYSKADDNGNMNIFVVNIADGSQRQLTNSKGINTEPDFSSDGRYIYFTSDRVGSPQIYRMSSNGGNVSRAVVGGNYSTHGEISPDGKNIALTRQTGGGFQIGLYNLETKQFHALSNGKLDEGATFSPNGQMLLYTSDAGGHSVLKLINLKGGVTQTLSDPSAWLRDPAWGPNLRH